MGIEVDTVHLIRPWGLLFILLGAVLPLLWRRYRAATSQFAALIPQRLARHLLINIGGASRFQPIHLLSALLILGGLAVAGPSWDKDRPAFMENTAPIILALDLSESMNGRDVTPSRLALAKAKAQALISRNPSTQFGLIAYAGSAHLVLPPTRDADLLTLYLDALASELISTAGRNTAAAVQEAKALLASADTPGTLVFITDGIDPGQADATRKRLQETQLQPLILVPGQAGTATTGYGGDPALMQSFADTIGADIGSVTPSTDDLEWLELSALSHFRDADQQDDSLQWKDRGYWLVWPLLALAILGIRRGWSLQALVLATMLSGPGLAPRAMAGPLADAFLTPDQQGRLAYEEGRFPDAARLFQDPYLRGLAAYHAANYELAIASFRRLDSARAWFYLGNSLAKRVELEEALTAYEQALARQPDFPEAKANLETVRRLEESLARERSRSPDMSADDIKFDPSLERGKVQEQLPSQSLTEAVWLENLSTSPKMFLRRKFQYQSQSAGAKQP
ncbi:MAG: VWA domain-containing protein [Marinobacter sp.]|uniref:VWA domain-containing protein n=1 Tax=Marinobacter sp. TaxID=50741 RepID=UPI00299F3310|nr:VWA domain-containing protein [Marinobacter sp.]MDX1755223.1 VWA domain-containing protein [Marinobacter sp.]